MSDPQSSLNMEALEDPKVDPGGHYDDKEFHKNEDRTVANDMANKTRILCWIMTCPSNHRKKAKHVKATWGRRCNILLFMSTINGIYLKIILFKKMYLLCFIDTALPSIGLPIGEGRYNLWGKTKLAFKYIYNNYFDKADWFLKADDDTYVIVENLRYMLQPYKSSEPIYFGCRFKPHVKQGYMSGGAGYVLSKAAVKRFAEVALSNSTLCNSSNNGTEDAELGKCMENVQVVAGDSRDSLGRGRFFPFVLEHHLIPGYVKKHFWYWEYIYYQSKEVVIKLIIK